MKIEMQLDAKDSAVLERIAVALESRIKIDERIAVALEAVAKNTAPPPIVGIAIVPGEPTTH